MSTGLGDLLERALGTIGVTAERVERWLGRPCGCRERKERLNALGHWARRVLAGKTAGAGRHLSMIIEESDEETSHSSDGGPGPSREHGRDAPDGRL